MSLGVLILLSFGCDRSREDRDINSQVEFGYQLIDQGQYSEAIHLFSKLLSQQDTSHVRVGLASSYAARAGITVQAYWDLVMPSVENQPPEQFESTKKLRSEWNEKTNSLSNEQKANLDSKSEELFKTHHQLEVLRWRFEKIPSIQDYQQVMDIEKARSLIVSIDSRGIKFYRSILDLVLVRYELETSASWFKQSISSKEVSICTNSFHQWMNHLPRPLSLVGDFIEDLEQAVPSKSDEIKKFKKHFQTILVPLVGHLGHLKDILCPK